jgi:hypothetical protein
MVGCVRRAATTAFNRRGVGSRASGRPFADAGVNVLDGTSERAKVDLERQTPKVVEEDRAMVTPIRQTIRIAAATVSTELLSTNECARTLHALNVENAWASRAVGFDLNGTGATL